MVSFLVDALVFILSALIDIYIFILLARAFASWLNPDPYNPIVRFLYLTTEPVLAPVRRILPIAGGIDFSPLVVLLILYLIRNNLLPVLSLLGRGV